MPKIFLFFFTFLILTPLLGGQTLAGQGEPIQIESDRMESVDGENAIFFSGRVVAHQGELVVHSDEMTVYYLSEEEKAALPPGDQRRLKKLFATGNVKIETEGWIGTGRRMDYFELERKVYLTGDAKVWQDDNLVTGEAVTMYLDEGKSIVERGGENGRRVRAYFYSGDNDAAAADNNRQPDLAPMPREQQPNPRVEQPATVTP